MLTNNERETLVKAAIKAREMSYSPYSNFAVGAALLTESGDIYTGANIESASYTPTVCAERVAFFSAVHKGEKSFRAIAIVGAKSDREIDSLCAPCGVCRQVMAEFCDPDFRILLGNSDGIHTCTLVELLPLSFSPRDLQPKGDASDENV